MALQNRSLITAFWNADGLRRDIAEVIDYLNETSVDIMFICETHLTPNNTFRVQNYTVYRRDRPDRPGGGVAIIIKNSLQHALLPNPQLTHLEAIGIHLELGNNEYLHLYSCYRSPTTPFVNEDFDLLLETEHPTVLLGDFNAKHSDWSCRATNDAGRRLFEYKHRHPNIQVHPPNIPTHYPFNPNHRPDILDMAITNEINAHLELVVSERFNSDHWPVECAISRINLLNYEIPRNSIDWQLYAVQLSRTVTSFPVLNSKRDIDVEIQSFINDVKDALRHASRPITDPNENYQVLPQRIRLLIQEKNRVRRRFQRTRDPILGRLKNRLQSQVHEEISQLKQDRWTQKIQSLQTEDNSLWRLQKVLRNPYKPLSPIHGTQGVKYTNADKAEAFADSLEAQCKPVYDDADLNHIERIHRIVIRDLNDETDNDDLNSASPSEVRQILKDLKANKAPGHDEIPNKALKSLHNVGVARLTNIFNAAMRISYFPTTWKKADVVLIPKSGKNPLFPENYRPISLLPTIGKVFEKIILNRLQPALAGHIPNEQFAFRAAHSTEHQTLRVAEFITKAFNERAYAGAIFLDVSKAFDKVWHQGLLFKLKNMDCPRYLLKLIQSFLSNREFRIKLKTLPPTFSTPRPIEAGVPQGSVLSPLLYIAYTADFPSTVRTELALFADDTAVMTKNTSARFAVHRLQAAATAMEEWFSTWRIQVNTEKSKVVLFCQHKSVPDLPNITMFGSDMPYSDQVKYLGLTYDKKLTWKPHIRQVRDKAKGCLRSLRPMLSYNSTLNSSNKLLLYLTIIRPAITYGCTTWGYAAKTYIADLQRIQNIALRQVLSAPWYIRNTILHRDLKTPTLLEYMISHAEKFYDNVVGHPNPLISDLGSYNPADFSVKTPKHLLLNN